VIDMFKEKGIVEYTRENLYKIPNTPGLYIMLDDRLRGVYVGRSDRDMRDRLKYHQKKFSQPYILYFSLPSSQHCYFFECELYERYKHKLLNEAQPGIPRHTKNDKISAQDTRVLDR
jgi:hypothetical protein